MGIKEGDDLIDPVKDEEKRTVFFLLLSTCSLVIDFFQIGNLPVDPVWIAILLCGTPIMKGAAVGLVTEFNIKADILVSIALIASTVIGEIFAAGEMAFIMAVGAYLEECTVARARVSTEKLVHLTSATTRVVRDDTEEMIPAEQVKIGDTLCVLAGETVAMDGVILKGKTSVDQSVMTGESPPVDKEEGDEVFSGTVNQFKTFGVAAQKVGADNSLQRMIRLMESADTGKIKIIGIADCWATWIVVITLLTAAATWFAIGEIIRSMTILVVFCPCTLVLATPATVMTRIGNAARFGILVREGDALEWLLQVKRIAFDKTGTLIYGKPAVTQIHSIGDTLGEKALLALVASSELRLEHPLGKATVAHYQQKYGALPEQPETFELLVGHGVTTQVAGRKLLAGNEALMTEREVAAPEALLSLSEDAKRNGYIVIYVAEYPGTIGMAALSDTLRPDAAQTMDMIHQAGVRIVLLTGDATPAASHIAANTGLHDVQTDYLPESKLEEIHAYQKAGEPVCMTDDDINDTPALKAAFVGITMGGVGSGIAIDAADIVLASDGIKEISHLLRFSQKTMCTTKINFAASMALNFAAIALAITGVPAPMISALVHNAGSVAVIIHSSLLLKWRKIK